MLNTFDVIVVGAGPGGCSAAYFLAKFGKSVLLVDKAKFPREKICGDALSSPALGLLDEIGILDKIIKSGNYYQIPHIKVSSPTGTAVKGSFPVIKDSRGYGFIVKRYILDNLLIENVRQNPSVNVLENFHMKELITDNGQFTGICGIHEQQEKTFGARFIIGADGVHSAVAKQIGISNNQRKYRAFAVRAYFENVENLERAIEVHYDKDVTPGYSWMFPCGPTSANVGLGVLGRFSNFKDTTMLFDKFLQNNKYAKEKLANATMVGTLKGWPLTLGSFNSKRSKVNVLLVGDAGSFIDPFFGEGIFQALQTGKFAATAISFGATESYVGEYYEMLWREKFSKDYLWGHHMQLLMNSPTALNWGVKLATLSKNRANNMIGVMAHVLPKWKLLI